MHILPPYVQLAPDPLPTLLESTLPITPAQHHTHLAVRCPLGQKDRKTRTGEISQFTVAALNVLLLRPRDGISGNTTLIFRNDASFEFDKCLLQHTKVFRLYFRVESGNGLYDTDTHT